MNAASKARLMLAAAWKRKIDRANRATQRPGSARMQPSRQQGVGINGHGLVELDAASFQQFLQLAALECLECLRATADELAVDENLRNRLAAGSCAQQGTDLSAAVVALV